MSEGGDTIGPDPPLRVLLVGDDAEDAATYRLKLQLDGYLTQVASVGEAARAVARAGLPDLIFLDLRRPRADDLKVLRRLQAGSRTRTIPIVLLSHQSESWFASQGANLGELVDVLRI